MSGREKPSISAEASARIRLFVEAIKKVEAEYGVSLWSDSNFDLRDDKRTEEFIMTDGDVYGQYDACIFSEEIDPDKLEIEDFDGWDK